MSAEPTAELRSILRRLKLSPVLETLPERAVLARQHRMPHVDFLELVLADEVARRDRISGERRAQQARLDPSMTLDTWQDHPKVRFDRDLWAELVTLRFVEEQQGLLILGPVGVGKSHLATTLGHVACRRGHSVLMMRADHMFKTLKAARLDQTYDTEMRKLIRLDVLIVDDLALKTMDALETHDFYELVVERHRTSSTIITSNRSPDEWIAVMADALLAQSAIDRLQATSHELVVEGESFRKRQKPGPTAGSPAKRPATRPQERRNVIGWHKTPGDPLGVCVDIAGPSAFESSRPHGAIPRRDVAGSS